MYTDNEITESIDILIDRLLEPNISEEEREYLMELISIEQQKKKLEIEEQQQRLEIKIDEQQKKLNIRDINTLNVGNVVERTIESKSKGLFFSKEEDKLEVIKFDDLFFQWEENTRKFIIKLVGDVKEKIQLGKPSIILSYAKDDGSFNTIFQLKKIFEQLDVPVAECEYQDILSFEKQLESKQYSHAIILVTPKYKELAAYSEEQGKKIKQALDEFGSQQDVVAKLHVLLCEGDFKDIALKVVDSKYLIRDYKKVFNNQTKITSDFQEQLPLLDFIDHLFNPSSYGYGIGMLPSIFDLSRPTNDNKYSEYKKLFYEFYKEQQKLNIEYRFKKVLLESYQKNEETLKYLIRLQKVKQISIEQQVNEIIDNLLKLENNQLKTNLILCQGILDETLINWVLERQLMSKKDLYVLSIDCGRKYSIDSKEYFGCGVLDFLKEKFHLKQHEIEEFTKQKEEQVIILFKNYDRLGIYDNLYVKNKLSNWPNLKVLVTCNNLFFQHRSYESCFLVDPGVIDLSSIKCDRIKGIFSENDNWAFREGNRYLPPQGEEGLRRSSIVEIKDVAAKDDVGQIKLRALHVELTNFLRNINKAFIDNKTLKANIEENPKIFISYAWEPEGTSRTRQQNHLKQITKDLYTLGFLAWLDLERMIGNIDQQMEGTILNSKYVLVIGTPLYTKRAADDKTNVHKEFLAIMMNKEECNDQFCIFPIKFLKESDEFKSFPEPLSKHMDYQNNLLDFCGIDDGEEYINQLTSLETGFIPRLLDLNNPDNKDKLQEYIKHYDILQKQLSLLPASHLLVDKGQDDVQAYDIDGRLEVYIEPSGVKANPSNTPETQLQFNLEDSLRKFLKDEKLKTYVALGDAGSGKTLFTLWTFKKYVLQPWHNYRNKELKIYLCSQEPKIFDIESNAIYLYLKGTEIQYTCIVKNYKHENEADRKETQTITIPETNLPIYQQIKKELTQLKQFSQVTQYDRNDFFDIIKPKWLPIYVPLKNYSYPGKTRDGEDRKKDDKQTPQLYIEEALINDYHISAQDLLNLKKGLGYEQNILFILDGYDELVKGNNPNFTEALLGGYEDVLLCSKKPNEPVLKENFIYLYIENQKVHLLLIKLEDSGKKTIIDKPINQSSLHEVLQKQILVTKSSGATSLIVATILEDFFKYTAENHKDDLKFHSLKWKYAKIFITGRPEHFDNETQHKAAFAIEDKQDPTPNFEVNYMAKFSSDEIQTYISKYKEADLKCAEELRKLENPEGKSPTTTFDILKDLGNLKELLTNPFLLNITLQALPILSKNTSTAIITRSSVYEGFIEYWYTKEIDRKEKAISRNINEKQSSSEDLKSICYQFAEQLVIQMFIQNTINISEKTPELWSFFNNLEHSFARETCPLRRSGNEYSFIHKSVYEYFLARYLVTTPWDDYELCLNAEALIPGKLYFSKESDKLAYRVLNSQGATIIDTLDLKLETELTLEFLNSKKEEILKITIQRGHTKICIQKTNGIENGYNASIARLLKEEPSVFSFIQDFSRPFIQKDQDTHHTLSSIELQKTNLHRIFQVLLQWGERTLAYRLITAKPDSVEHFDDELKAIFQGLYTTEPIATLDITNHHALAATIDVWHVQDQKIILAPEHIQLLKNQQSIFLNLVGWGDQETAQRMLEADPKLALLKGDLTDCSGRTFKNITAFQYALWALDYHMWTMVKNYLSKEDTRAQLEELNQIAKLDEQQGWSIITSQSTWPLISWTVLIKALDDYVKNYDAWDGTQCQNHWRQQVGGAQLILPAHVINEYSHPSRPFYPCPKWSNEEVVLPRTGVTDWRIASGYKLGSGFGWVRADWDAREREDGDGKYGGWSGVAVRYDLAAVSELLKSRTEQARLLLESELNFRPSSSPRPKF